MSLLLAFVLQASAAETPPSAFEVQGFRSQSVIEIAAPREIVWQAATGDITGWWDHSFWDAPAVIFIDAQAGGSFFELEEFEIHPDALTTPRGPENGAVHARVIYADAPETLRLDGPLGLSGRAVQIVTTWTLAESADGAGTVFSVDLSMAGEIDADLAEAVHRVWIHFIGERLKPYVEAGCHEAPDEPCAAFAD